MIMGFLKAQICEQTTEVRVKGSLKAESSDYEMYFCAINFNLRKLAMVKIDDEGAVDEPVYLRQFIFTDLQRV